MSIIENLFIGSLTSVIVVNFTHPFDFIKTRIQIENSKNILKNTIKREGFRSLWKGIQIAYIRELNYTSVKLGMYKPICKLFKAEKHDFTTTFFAGSISGCLGAILGNPYDLIKTKIMASKNKMKIKQVFKSIYYKNNLIGFYKGLPINCLRAMVVNGTKMSCYDNIKTFLSKKSLIPRNSIYCQFISSFLTGFCMAITVTPFDMIRTQIMYSNNNSILKIIKSNYLYKGFIPIWLRFTPLTILQLIVFDRLSIYFQLEPI